MEKNLVLDKANLEAYHKTNMTYIVIFTVIWFVVSLGTIFVAPALNKISFLGFPLGYYMGAQGSVLIFIAEIFYYSYLMDQLDKKHGFDELLNPNAVK
ncbi:MAG: DUF4212 domain-containing protein [Desulfuromonadaceae bacterium]|nr:DUF4212 domain-containing protein [Desulfuromonadaceae bacterium]